MKSEMVVWWPYKRTRTRDVTLWLKTHLGAQSLAFNSQHHQKNILKIESNKFGPVRWLRR